MSQSFRAVKEIWSVHSSCFIEAEKVIALLHDLPARVGTASDEREYGDNKAVWLEDGNRVLDYMEADERFNAVSFKDSIEEQGVVINKNDLTSLVDNMRTLAKQWRSSLIIVSLHGALIATAAELHQGMKISIHVYVTDKRAPARVVYVDPRNPQHCGIELDEPRNIWGVPLSPDDWREQQF